MSRRVRSRALPLWLLLLCLAPAGRPVALAGQTSQQLPQAQQPPQQAATAVLPQQIHVGDVFYAAVRLDLPAGARAILPDTLLGGEDLEPAGRVEIRADTLPGGGLRLTGLYPLTAWRTGPSALDPIRIRVLTDGGESLVPASFPSFEVASVLPADTTGIEPKPAKDVIGGSRVLWPWLLGGLALLLAALALYLWRRRKAPAEVRELSFDPRATALAALSVERAEQLLAGGDLRAFYIELAEALRFYASFVTPLFARDRTTPELAAVATAAPIDGAETRALIELLERADAVKFAREQVSIEAARADWHDARSWVTRVLIVPAPSQEPVSDRLESAA